MDFYNKRGVSAQKEEVHAATAGLDKGLFPLAFCKVYPDFLNGDADWVNVMHADGAGTKSVLAYLYWKETGDLDVWKGIAQDAVVMNIDDLLCVGIYDNLLFSSTIDRNKRLIPGEVLKALIEGTQAFFDRMSGYGCRIHYLGGETADVGDVVRTIAVNGTMTARWPKAGVITNERIGPGDAIVGFASFGQSVYEDEYNSGIGSNGLTSARHDALSKYYGQAFPESFDPGLPNDVTYIGEHRLTDPVGKLLLSPTRTYLPLVKEILKGHFEHVHGLIHSSGGGQTKVLKYVRDGIRIVKDNLFDPPSVFGILQRASGADDREMYQVFNMGQRLELFTKPEHAETFISISKKFGIDAQVIGRVEVGQGRGLTVAHGGREISY